jgi:hypothetical protein
LKEFEIDADRRKVSQMQVMVAEFTRLVAELDREIQVEEARSGISDPAHYAYSTYATAARRRRDNLKRSVTELNHQLATAKRSLSEAVEEFEAAVSPQYRRPVVGAVDGGGCGAGSTALDLNRAS